MGLRAQFAHSGSARLSWQQFYNFRLLMQFSSKRSKHNTGNWISDQNFYLSSLIRYQIGISL